MTSYTVHLVDPRRSPFVVNPYTANGLKFPTLDTLNPGAASANTSLLWYGKGSPNYGERVQENVLHLLEHFAGPTAPANPVAGQLWFDRRIFFHTAAANNDGWYVWQDLPADPNGGTWNRIPNGVAVMPVSGTEPAAPTAGTAVYDGIGGAGTKYQWYFNSSTSTLYQGIFEAGHPLHQTWTACGYMEDASVGASPSAAVYKPQQRLMVQTFGRSTQTDAANWAYANGVWASPIPPVDPVEGTLWYDTTGSPSGTLFVYDGSSFSAVVGAFLPTAGGTMTGQIDMGYNRIVNLGTPILSTDATTKAYVDAALTGSIELDELTDVTITAPSARQFITNNGGSPIVWINDSIQLGDIFGVTASLVEVNYLGGVTSSIQTQIDGKLNLTGGSMLGNIAMGTFNITGLGNPTAGADATNRNYVDSKDIASGAFDSNTGILTLVRGDASTILIPGFITGTSIAYNTLPSELLGQLPPVVVPTNLDEAVHNLDNIVRRRTTPRRSVQTGIGGSPPQLIYTTPRYEVESFKLFVFVDGIKVIASQRGYQSVLFDTMVLGSPPIGGPMQLSCDVDPVLTGGIGSPQYDYDFDVTVDGGAPQTITINGGTNEADTFCSVVDTINEQLVGAYAILEDQAITIYSNSLGAGSSIAITDGTLGSPIFPLFGSMLYYDSIDAAVAGADYDYDEIGFPGGLSTSVAFLAPVTGQTLEFIVIGQNGTTV